MDTVAKEHNWTINKGSIALMWRGGCIIRSVFLGKIKEVHISEVMFISNSS